MDNQKLDAIIAQLTELNNKIDKSEERMITKMKDILNEQKQEIKLLKSENHELKTQLEAQEEKISNLENHNRKNNLVMIGIDEKEGNGYELENMVSELIRKKMKINLASSDINFVSRMGKRSEGPRPVLFGCTTWRLKKEILRNKWALKDLNVVIKEDFSKETREDRRELGKVLINFKQAGKQIGLRGNKILYRGKLYSKNNIEELITLQEDTESNNPNKRPRTEDDQPDMSAKPNQETHNSHNNRNKRLNFSNFKAAQPKSDVITNFFGMEASQNIGRLSQ